MELRRVSPSKLYPTLVLSPSELDIFVAGSTLGRGHRELRIEEVEQGCIDHAAILAEQCKEKQSRIAGVSGQIAVGETGSPISVGEGWRGALATLAAWALRFQDNAYNSGADQEVTIPSRQLVLEFHDVIHAAERFASQGYPFRVIDVESTEISNSSTTT